MGSDPVFYDPEQRRWPRIRRILLTLVVGVAVPLIFLVWGVIASPVLPTLGLPGAPASPGAKGLKPEALPPPPPSSATNDLSPRLRALEERQKKLLADKNKKNAKRPSKEPEPLRAAFLVNWDEQGLVSLKENHEHLDLVFPEWLHLTGADSRAQEDVPAETLAFLKTQSAQLRWLPLVNNFNGREWEGETLIQALSALATRARVIRDLVAFAKRVQGAGICLDFEDVAAGKTAGRKSPYEIFLLFVQELGAALHREKLLLAVNAPLQRASFPYATLSRPVDYVVLMGYDQHWASGDAGPIAGQSWFADSLRLAAAEIPPEKLIVALGNFAYDWTEKESAASLTTGEAIRLARSAKAEWQWDAASLNPFFGYRDAKGRVHSVWVLDATTAFNQLGAARSVRPRGYALWRMGSEDSTLWKLLAKDAVWDAAAARALADVSVGHPVEPQGTGEVMRVTSVPAPGRRDIVFDEAKKAIVSVRFKEYPSPTVLSLYGGARKKIVLTFDDGPDPETTPAILDALFQAHVPAVFFVVGVQAEHHPELLDRIVLEGHEVGNHTFSHPDISKISLTQLEMELAATQRLIESRTGRQTLLFRPPYGLDTEPRTPEEIQTLEAVNQLGYLCVGMKIDPHDWAQPGVDEIVRRVVEQAERGEGNIVLLHDSGGDRRQTIQALPRIIQELKKRGYQFVSLSSLLDLSGEQLMPPLSSNPITRWMNRTGFGLIGLAMRALELLFFLGILLGLGRLALIGVLAVLEHRRKRRLVFPEDYRPSVAVIVPAYNEEKVIVRTIEALLASDYRGPLEILVVDDGSKDETFARAREAFASEPRVAVHTKPNGGKARALNYGFARTGAEIVVALDADTIFKPDTVGKLVRHFADPMVGAAAGNAKVGNRLNLLTRWQALEYITCQNLDRRAFSYLNCITVVPGAVGAWRRKLIQLAGGFTHETLAEDADLTMLIRRMGYRVVNEDEAIALTEAPDTVGGFVKQRFRWMFGTIQAAFRHLGALFNPMYGALGFVALPNILIFQVFFPLVSPILDLTLAISLGSWAFDAWFHPGQAIQGSWETLVYYVLFVVVDYMAGFLAFALEPKEDKRLLVWLFLQRFFYRQLMYYVAIKSVFAALRGTAVGWGKLERKATVQA